MVQVVEEVKGLHYMDVWVKQPLCLLHPLASPPPQVLMAYGFSCMVTWGKHCPTPPPLFTFSLCIPYTLKPACCQDERSWGVGETRTTAKRIGVMQSNMCPSKLNSA